MSRKYREEEKRISNMSRKYKEEELKDSIVLDNEGYICGYVSDLDVKKGIVILNLYGFETKNKDVVDEKELVQRLIEAAPRKGILSRKLSTEEFFDWIRISLNLSEERISTEHLVKYANLRNIVIPNKTEEVNSRVERGFIEWASIDKIAFSDLGACIILNNSMEAEKRGIVPSETAEFINTKNLSGKMVIDSEGKLIGTAAKFMPGYPPGILINLEQFKKQLETPPPTKDASLTEKANLPWRNLGVDYAMESTGFFTDREPAGKYWIAGAKKEVISEPAKEPDITAIKDQEETKSSENKIQNKAIERETIKEIVIDWDRIAKIGDVVFLKDTLKALNENVTSVSLYAQK